MFLKIYFDACVKEMSAEAMDRGINLIFSSTIVSIIIDNGATPTIGSFLIFC
jgi:hypothetical protein